MPVAIAEDFGIYQHGTVVGMRIVDCASSPRGFMASVAGQCAQLAAETCPEYALVSDTVVFVIVGRSSNQIIPLADVVDFLSIAANSQQWLRTRSVKLSSESKR